MHYEKKKETPKIEDKASSRFQLSNRRHKYNMRYFDPVLESHNYNISFHSSHDLPVSLVIYWHAPN